MTPLRRRLALGLLVALAGSVVVVWHGSPAHANLVGRGFGEVAPHATPTSTPSFDSPGTFTIAGAANGLYPGLTKPLTLLVTNPQHFPIVVTSLIVTVHNASLGCTAANISVTPFSGTLSVGSQASASVTLHITLAHQAPDACQGAVFPLRYFGLAAKR